MTWIRFCVCCCCCCSVCFVFTILLLFWWWWSIVIIIIIHITILKLNQMFFFLLLMNHFTIQLISWWWLLFVHGSYSSLFYVENWNMTVCDCVCVCLSVFYIIFRRWLLIMIMIRLQNLPPSQEEILSHTHIYSLYGYNINDAWWPIITNNTHSISDDEEKKNVNKWPSYWKHTHTHTMSTK